MRLTPALLRSPRTRALQLVALVALAATSSATARSQRPSVPRAATARAFPSDSAVLAIIKQRVEEKRSAGIVVGLLDASGRTRVVAYGDPGPGQPPLDGNSVFEIGSISKVFTSTVLAQMVMQGTVKLDDPAQKFLPAAVRIPTRNEKQITLGMLSTQNSGLPRMPTNFNPRDPANPYADYTVRQMYDFVTGYTLTRDPGELFEYSNLGVGLLGHVLALASGKTYEQLERDMVWTPLGMTRTAITLTPWMKEHLALGHDDAGKVVPNWDLLALAGAGAIRSTAFDMLKFVAANVNTEHGPLGKAMAFAHEARASAGGTARIGLNWIIRHTGADTIVWHNGGTAGYRTFAGFVPSRKMGVVVLTNSGGAGADDIGLHLLNQDLPLTPRPAPAATPPVQRPANPPARATTVARLDSVVTGFLAGDHGTAGVSVAVVRGNDTLAFSGWGLADREKKIPATAATTYRIASITKQFTSAAVMRLAERGRIALTDTIGHYLPQIPAAWRPVTTLQLLNQTSGLPDYSELPARWGETLRPDGLVAMVARDTMLFAPGSKWDYSNTNYLLLGMLAEKLYAKSYAEIIRDEFATPLGLAHTRYCEDAAGANGQAVGYVRNGAQFDPPPYRHISQPFASGALCSTIGDLVAWNRALHGGKVVNAASYMQMTTPQGAATASAYGLGLRVFPVSGHRSVMHSGAGPGFFATNAWFADDTLSVTILMNSVEYDSESPTVLLLRHMTRIALGLPVTIAYPVPTQSATQLARYEGRYTVQIPGRPLGVRFHMEGKQLMMQADGQPRAVALYGAGEHSFGNPNDPTMRITFVVENGVATRMVFEQNGAKLDAVKN